jgi:hypothetical protein
VPITMAEPGPLQSQSKKPGKPAGVFSFSTS